MLHFSNSTPKNKFISPLFPKIRNMTFSTFQYSFELLISSPSSAGVKLELSIGRSLAALGERFWSTFWTPVYNRYIKTFENRVQ